MRIRTSNQWEEEEEEMGEEEEEWVRFLRPLNAGHDNGTLSSKIYFQAYGEGESVKCGSRGEARLA